MRRGSTWLSALYVSWIIVGTDGLQRDVGFEPISGVVKATLLRSTAGREFARLSEYGNAWTQMSTSIGQLPKMYAALTNRASDVPAACADCKVAPAGIARKALPPSPEGPDFKTVISRRMQSANTSSGNRTETVSVPNCAPYSIATTSEQLQDVCNGVDVSPQVRGLLDAIDGAGTNGTIAFLALQVLEAVLDEEQLESLIPDDFAIPAALNLSTLLTQAQQAAVLAANNASSLDEIQTVQQLFAPNGTVVPAAQVLDALALDDLEALVASIDCIRDRRTTPSCACPIDFNGPECFAPRAYRCDVEEIMPVGVQECMERGGDTDQAERLGYDSGIDGSPPCRFVPRNIGATYSLHFRTGCAFAPLTAPTVHRCNGTDMDTQFYAARGLVTPWDEDQSPGGAQGPQQLARQTREVYVGVLQSCVESSFRYAVGGSLSLALTHDPRLLLTVRPINFERMSDRRLDVQLPLSQGTSQDALVEDDIATSHDGTLADGTAADAANPAAPWERQMAGGTSSSAAPRDMIGGLGATSWEVRGSVESLLEARVELDIGATQAMTASTSSSGFWPAGRLSVEAYLGRCRAEWDGTGGMSGPSACGLPHSGRRWPSSRVNETTGNPLYEARAMWIGPSRVLRLALDEQGYEVPEYRASLNVGLLLGLLIPSLLLLVAGSLWWWRRSQLRRVEERRATTDATKLTPEEAEALGSLAGLEQEPLAIPRSVTVSTTSSHAS